MPDLRIPRRSGAHRIAAIALYRALLTQCRATPLARNQQEELQNIVRNRFRQAQHSHSIRRLRVGFEAGYEAIDRLDAAVAGSEESKVYITSLLERAPTKVKQAPAPKQAEKIGRADEAGGQHVDADQRPKISLFDRPLPLEKLSGKRHVPVLFNASSIPVLRLKKPQPETLSRFIRLRVEQRQKWHDLRHRLDEDVQLAAQEDEWDDIVSPLVKREQTLIDAGLARQCEEPTWQDYVYKAQREVQGKINDEKVRNRIMAEKMQGVVDRERELFESEKVARKESRRQERLQRRQHSTEDPDHVQDLDLDSGTSEPSEVVR